MDWTAQQLYATISGWHIALWLLAYCAWRFLMSSRAEAGVQSAANDVDAVSGAGEARRRNRKPVAYGATGRWAHRSEMLVKMGWAPARRAPSRRRARRAA